MVHPLASLKYNRSMDKLDQSFPSKPGVYIFKDENDTVLYVGKAKNLRSRVSSYFSKQISSRPWTAVMVGLAKTIETTVVNSEIEALMLEAVLIKQHQPRFNILLTDDKSYPYIKIYINEAYPRLQVVRRRLKDGAKYFGPYLSARSATLTCEFLRKLYGVHTANRPILSNHDRPCLNCQLENNSCPYSNEISEDKYGEQIEKAITFLEGKRNNLIVDVQNKMDEASANQNYELAGNLRDQLHALQHVTERQQVISTNLDDYDAIGSASLADNAAVVLLQVREGRVYGQKTFYFTLGAGQSEGKLIEQFLVGIYQNFSDLPPLLALPVKLENQVEIEEWLKTIRGGAFEIRSAERGDKRSVLELAQKNAQLKLEMKLIKEDKSQIGLIALKELLKLKTIPYRIEAVDISNLGTSEPVGATVCFINGKPDKNEYRKYKIRYGQNAFDGAKGEGEFFRQTPNDFMMIEEVTRRRFSDTSRPIPDLFVVDGGPEQLKFAINGLTEQLYHLYVIQGLEEKAARQKCEQFSIISLAKKPDRIFLPNRKLPIAASRGNKGLLLLAQIRDEVHRYVIGFHRSRQRKKSLGTK